MQGLISAGFGRQTGAAEQAAVGSMVLWDDGAAHSALDLHGTMSPWARAGSVSTPWVHAGVPLFALDCMHRRL